ncbi:MAG: diguanylate cyclase [marine benthic group bacterium]|nr:diguanylate cyclase [Gemmatimonadota bacterium]
MACVRVCPVEAISVSGQTVEIVESGCIECGICVPSCHHEAIDVVGDLDLCRDAMETGNAVLLLPTEANVYFYPATPEQLLNACYAAGFAAVYYEQLGDELVARAYEQLLSSSSRRAWVRSTSPIVVNYCRTKLPELLPFLAPVATPSVALSRYVRNIEGEDARIVYAGVGAPGVNGDQEELDACLSFDELERLFVELDINPLDEPQTLSRIPPERRRHASMPGGLPRAVLEDSRQSSSRFRKERGLSSLAPIARAVLNDENALGFVDVLPFEGNLGHPAYGPPEDLYWRKEIADVLEPPRASAPVLIPEAEPDVSASFEPILDDHAMPDPAEVQRILDLIGTTPDGRMWNTGSCGHSTCLEFATAVARGRSTLALCPIYLSRQYERAARDALHDALTGAFTFRVLNERLDEELSRASRTGTSIALLFVDIDKFKPINDTYGHGTGNALLVGVSRILQEAVRSTDIVCRYGGDEFVLILVNPDRRGAGRVAEEIRAKTEAFTVPVEGENVGVTLSIGVAYHSGITRSNLTREELMAEADAALYVAKAQGGNTVHPAIGGQLVR